MLGQFDKVGDSMATADQMRNLVKAYCNNDSEKFKTIVLQIAAHEAQIGHTGLARDLKKEIENVGNNRTNLIHMPKTMNPMLHWSRPDVKLSELIVDDSIQDKIKRILLEYNNRNKLLNSGLHNRRKILLEGNPGTGKTMTASIIASELDLPLFTVQVDKLVTKFMGETSARLRQIFESMDNEVGVYLFDEFDAIGSDRSIDNEVGEMRRILNSFLQFIELDESPSIIIAATNNQKLLDKALFRRFDDVIHYDLPDIDQIKRLFEYKLKIYDSEFCCSPELIETSKGLSHAEISLVCDDAIKGAILNDSPINSLTLISLLNERHRIYKGREA